MKRAIIYTSGESVEVLRSAKDVQEQFNLLNCFCTENGIQIQAVFEDSNNERLTDRTEFKHLLEYVLEMKQQIDCCVFTSWDRFSVDPIEIQTIKEQFELWEIEMITIQDCNTTNKPKKVTIPKRTRERIGRLSTLILNDYEWLRKQERAFSRSKQSMIDKVRSQMERNEVRLLNITDQYTPDELTEQIYNEDFQALNTAGDYGNSELIR